MRPTIKHVLIGLLMIFFDHSFAAKNDSALIKELEFRLKKIEDYRMIDDKKFENKSKELDLKIEEYKQQKMIMDWIALGLGGITIISLWGFWQKAKALANKKIEEKFDTLLDEKKQQLINIITKHDKEDKLKNENTIHVVCASEAKTEFLIEFFKKLGFAKPIIKKISSYEEIDKQIKYDILFLFREEGNSPLSDELSKAYIENSRTDSVVFIFGKHIDLSTIKSRSSSATFWSQLYGNLISALKYQELID